VGELYRNNVAWCHVHTHANIHNASGGLCIASCTVFGCCRFHDPASLLQETQ